MNDMTGILLVLCVRRATGYKRVSLEWR